MRELNIPQDFQFSPIESSIEKYKAVLATNKELSNTLKETREHYIKELHDLLGSDVNEYLSFRQKIRDRLRDIISVYRPTPEGEKIRSEAERKLSGEAHEFINSLGIDSNNVKNVQKKYLVQSSSAVEKAMNITTTPYTDVPSREIPERTSMAGWTVKKPPYDSSWGSEARYGTAGSRYTHHQENKLTGEIGCKSLMEIYGAYDFDYSNTEAFSEMLMWFKMDTRGYIEASINLYCIETPYRGCLDNELGFSDAFIRQNSWCYIGTSQPQNAERSYVPLLQYERETDTEGCWSGNFLQPGDNHIVNLRYEHRAFENEQLVLVAIGIKDFNQAIVNDMSFNTDMTSRWIVTEVWLRSVP